MLKNHPIPDFSEGDSVIDDPLGVHIPQETADGKRTSFKKKDLQHTINTLKTDVHFFQKTMLTLRGKSFELSHKQLELIKKCQSQQFTVGVFNRQGGKSTAFGTLDTHDVCFAENDEAIVFAPILNQTEIIFGKVRDFVQGNQLLWSYVDKRGGFKKGYLRMMNGNSITVMSASDQSHIRGYSPTKIQIDESQDIADFKYYEDILPSGAATGAKIQEVGTPKGRNHFFETWRGDTFKKVKQIWSDCPFMDNAYIEMMRAKLPKKSFDQEFLCVWDLDEGSAFDKEMLDRIMILKGDEAYDPNGTYYAGIDVGKSPARTVLNVWRYLGDGKYKQVYLRTFYYASYKQIISELTEELEIWRPVATGIDRTGVGDAPADLLDDMFDGIVPVFYSVGVKQTMVDDFTLLGENSRIELIDDMEQKKQFMNWSKKKLASGRHQFFAPKRELDDQVNANIITAHILEDYGSRLTFKMGGESTASALRY